MDKLTAYWSAYVALHTVATAMGGGASAAAGAFFSDMLGFITNRFSSQADRKEQNSPGDPTARLHNKHLDRLIGEAVAAELRRHAATLADRTERKSVDALANDLAAGWETLSHSGPVGQELDKLGPEAVFGWMMQGFDRTSTALTAPVWQALLEQVVGTRSFPRHLVPAMANALHLRLPHAVRELLKHPEGGKAFIGLQLLTLGRLLEGVEQTNLALGEVSEGIDTLRTDILRLRHSLPQDAADRTLILAESDKALAILTRLETKIDRLQTGQDELSKQVERVQTTADEIKAAVQVRPAPQPVPAPRTTLTVSNPTWVGAKAIYVERKSEYEALAKAQGPGRVACVRGMPGTGKSYLVERFFNQRRTERLPKATFVLPHQPCADVDAFGFALCEHFKVPLGPTPDWPALAACFGERDVLYVENADFADTLNAVAQLFQRLPKVAGIVTTRVLAADARPGWRWVEVGPYQDAADGVRQLRQEAPGRHLGSEDELAGLSRSLGHLPLALHLAAGYLRDGRTVAEFLAALRKSNLGLRPASDADLRLTADEAKAILSTSFAISFDDFTTRSQREPDGGRWSAGLGALAHLPAAGFGFSLAAAVAGLDDPADCLRHAAERSLVFADAGRWRFHPLLAEYLQTKADAGWSERRTQWFMDRLPEQRAVDPQRQELNAETDALVQWLGTVPLADRAAVVKKGNKYATQNGPYGVWTEFCAQALAAVPAPSLDDQSWLLFVQSQTAQRAGNMDLSLAAARAEAAVELQLGRDREAAVALGLAADVLMQRGELDEALRIRREEELRVYERLGDVREKAVTMGKIADILQARGQLDEALRIRREECIPVYERLGDVRSKAVTIRKIADVYGERGRLDEAIAEMKSAHSILKGRGMVRDESVFRVLTAQHLLRRAKPGDREEAATLLREALAAAVKMKIPEADHIRAIQRQHGLG